jgi:hypothetical protein
VEFLELGAALPAGFEVRPDLGSFAGRQFSIGIPKQLLVFRVAHGRATHAAPF